MRKEEILKYSLEVIAETHDLCLKTWRPVGKRRRGSSLGYLNSQVVFVCVIRCSRAPAKVARDVLWSCLLSPPQTLECSLALHLGITFPFQTLQTPPRFSCFSMTSSSLNLVPPAASQQVVSFSASHQQSPSLQPHDKLTSMHCALTFSLHSPIPIAI